MDTLAQHIRAARGDLTQQQFANRLGVSIVQISRWESGSAAPRTHATITALRNAGVPYDLLAPEQAKAAAR